MLSRYPSVDSARQHTVSCRLTWPRPRGVYLTLPQAELAAAQTAVDQHNEAVKRLEALRKEMESERDVADAKLQAAKKKYDAEVEERQRLQADLEDCKAKWYKDKQALVTLQGELDAVNANKARTGRFGGGAPRVPRALTLALRLLPLRR